MALLPSPRTSDTNGAGHHGDGGMDLRTAVAEIPLLPTPAVNDMGAAYTPETWDEWTATMKAKHSNGNGHGKSLNVEAQRLLPTPTRRDHKDTEVRREPHRPDDTDTLARALTDVLLPTPSAADSTGGHERRGGERGEELLLKGIARAVTEGTLLPTPTTEPLTGNGHARHLGAEVQPARWGEYEPAIRRWEALTRPAPEPTKLNAKGNPKLSDEFDEWLMGFPAGWITDVPGVTWNEALKACGNGVVWQQGAAALRFLLTELAGAA